MTIDAVNRALANSDEFGTPETSERPRILIVDDIADNRMILNRRFSRRNYDVTEADGGQAALDLIAGQEFDAVLLDVMMPDMDGLEVLRRIRQTKSSLELPVVMVTAKSQSEDVVEALEAKANDYVTKPVDFAIALARVNAQVDRKRAEDTIKRTNAKLKNINDDLEQRIAERTSALVETNRQLQDEVQLRMRSEAEVREMALHDSLTGLGNRVLFRCELDHMLDKVTNLDEVSVLFIDLDGFKGVNDTLGHSAGDELLVRIADVLNDLVDETDLVARLGGDEFAILHHNENSPESAKKLADRIVRTVAEIGSLNGQPVSVGASIGIVVASADCARPEDLLRNADVAMYKAKADGRGNFCLFDPVMNAVLLERRQIEIDMMTAFVQGQFEVHYQPLVSLETNCVCSFEALTRWRHPQRGLIPPTKFIPIAEETGLIVQIGDWVMREACIQASKWEGNARVGVNVSPVQFMRGNVINTVIGALAVSGLNPNRLEIEITESTLLEGTKQTLDTLTALRELGVRIVMDDFGTGYSSLGYLHSFPFDKIKIDRSFVRDSDSSNNSGAIVQAITELGRKFGISTTAEGVETAEQLRFVVSEGCSEAQGWIFSQPIPPGDIADFMAQHNAKTVEMMKQDGKP